MAGRRASCHGTGMTDFGSSINKGDRLCDERRIAKRRKEIMRWASLDRMKMSHNLRRDWMQGNLETGLDDTCITVSRTSIGTISNNKHY